MPWAGKECSIPAATLSPDLSPTKVGQEGGEVSPAPDDDEPVRVAMLVFIPDDDAKGTD